MTGLLQQRKNKKRREAKINLGGEEILCVSKIEIEIIPIFFLADLQGSKRAICTDTGVDVTRRGKASFPLPARRSL